MIASDFLLRELEISFEFFSFTENGLGNFHSAKCENVKNIRLKCSKTVLHEMAKNPGSVCRISRTRYHWTTWLDIAVVCDFALVLVGVAKERESAVSMDANERETVCVSPSFGTRAVFRSLLFLRSSILSDFTHHLIITRYAR